MPRNWPRGDRFLRRLQSVCTLSVWRAADNPCGRGFAAYAGKVANMKILIVVVSLGLLLVGLPLLQGRLVSLAFDEALSDPHSLSIFYLFIVPAWVLATAVYVVETYRRRIFGRNYKTGNIPLLGLLGLVLPTVGLALSPLAVELGLAVWAGVAVSGLVSGLLGALLFGLVMFRIDKSAGP